MTLSVTLINAPMAEQQLQSRILKTDLINWRQLQFIQQEDFKEWILNGDQKLFDSLLRYQFIDPFKVWENDGVLYCLDGKHRHSDLLKLIEKGVEVPESLPAIFIDCRDKKEAAELVLVYSSAYAKVSETGFTTFIEMYGIHPDEMKMVAEIPGLTFPEAKFEEPDFFNDPGISLKNQFGVIVMCEDEQSQEDIFNKLTSMGYTCKIAVT